ncbi:flavodoxin family protein [Carboxydocella sp. JDF658]|uniref:flavodoxin family protein n=1 Tax=Carboxydocella sp. JDF658 TaxID=1926600 RepID=UPI00135645E5|nr:flavodoxin family protein [Carboxydocella sp. JDF658]
MEGQKRQVLALVGSYRKGGNTDLIIEQALAGARDCGAETEKFFVDDLRFTSCQGCYECRPAGVCKLEDDVRLIRDKIEAADGIIIGTPIYGNYMTGQLKTLLDRLMGVLTRRVFDPREKKFQTFSRMVPKQRNVLLVFTAGAPHPECAEDAEKLLRRMMEKHTNGGFIEALVATSVTSQGAIAMSVAELLELARRSGIPIGEEQARQAWERNQRVLARAFELGRKL